MTPYLHVSEPGRIGSVRQGGAASPPLAWSPDPRLSVHSPWDPGDRKTFQILELYAEIIQRKITVSI